MLKALNKAGSPKRTNILVLLALLVCKIFDGSAVKSNRTAGHMLFADHD